MDTQNIGNPGPGSAEDQSVLLIRQPEIDIAFQVASTPTPILKDVNFAAAGDDSGDASDSSIDDDAIEKMLEEEDEV